MDLLEIIKKGTKRLPDGYGSAGIDAVILHIERAEKYWVKAKTNNDEVMFTDVIYRTNQAFEGALKEAYLVLANKDPKNKTPFKIEQYLEESGVLKERVLNSLTNYRKEWRNPSTHDYQLFFSEQESLLAIASVSTFCIVLLEQIITKANENYEKERVKSFSRKVVDSIKGYESLPFSKKVFSLLAKSYEYIDITKNKHIREHEYLGLLTGFIEAVDSSIKVGLDVKLSDEGHRADMILSFDNEQIIVDIKRHKFMQRFNPQVKNQLLNYLTHANIKNGVIMLFDESATKGSYITEEILLDESPRITTVSPIN